VRLREALRYALGDWLVMCLKAWQIERVNSASTIELQGLALAHTRYQCGRSWFGRKVQAHSVLMPPRRFSEGSSPCSAINAAALAAGADDFDSAVAAIAPAWRGFSAEP
jgi:hypothetical protein